MMLLVILLSVVASAVEEHHYTSIEGFNTLLLVEKVIYQRIRLQLQHYMKKESRDAIMKYMEVADKFNRYKDLDKDVFLHPLDGLHFMKHVVYGWETLELALKREDIMTVDLRLQSMNTLRKETYYPRPEDILYVAAAISRIQHFYQLPIKKLVQGIVQDKYTGQAFQSIEPLNAWDCNAIGKGAMLLGRYKDARMWFQIAQEKCRKNDTSIEIRDVMYNDRDANNKFREWASSMNGSEKTYTYRQLASKASDPASKSVVFANMTRFIEPMAMLCRGEKIRLKTPRRRLTCKYFTRSLAYLQIGPLKMEEISVKPAIIMFHNFLTEVEMNKFVKIAKPQLKPSKSLEVNVEERPVVTIPDPSKKRWISSSEDPQLDAKVTRRIEMATGLQLTSIHSSEPFQAVNYGVGGERLPHVDSHFGTSEVIPSLKMSGDRKATFMIYIGNVFIGGGTVFPLLGVSIPPRRGAAVFWYNTLKSGEGDLLSLHAGCPVIYGSKWIINKWINTYNQMFREPCGSDYMDRHTLPS